MEYLTIMSDETTRVITGPAIVTSVSLPQDKQYYTGPYGGIVEVEAAADLGKYVLYNRISPGLRVVPSVFREAGNQEVTIYYKTGVGKEVLESKVSVDVKLDVPVKLRLIKAPKYTTFKEGQALNIEGAEFEVTFASGHRDLLTYREVIPTLSAGSIVYTYRYNGSEASTTEVVDVVTLSKIEATTSKTSYKAGEAIVAEDFKVTAIYSDGTTEQVRGFDIDLKTAEVGATKVKVTYKGKSVSVAISVVAKIESAGDLDNLFDKVEDTISDGTTYVAYKLKGNVELGGNLDLPGSRLDITSEPTTIDLKGHTLTTQLIKASKDIEIKDGTIELKDKKRGLLVGVEGVDTITLTNVELKSAIESSAASLIQTEKTSIHLKDCKMISTCDDPSDKYLFSQWQDGASAYVENVETNTMIGTNGNIKDLHITLKNSKTNAGIYLSASGEYIIDGGTYTSNDQSALEVKAGKVTLKAGTFKGNGNYNHVPYGNGASTCGYDISIVSNKGYRGGSVTIESGVVGRVAEFKDSKDVAKLVAVKDLRAASTITSIKVATPPSKSTYKSGDKFDATGMTIEAALSDSTTKILAITDSKLSYVDPGILQLSKILTIRYTDDYTTCSCDYVITVTGSEASKSEGVRVWDDEVVKLETTDIPTQVAIPEGTITGDTAQLIVATQDPAVDKPVEVVEGYNSVGAVDLTLEVDGKQVSEFSKPVAVTVSTVKGLEGVGNFKVQHGDEDISIKSYDSSSGKLTFETTHFSLFTIGVDSTVINTTTNTGYSDLKTALAAVDNNHTLKLYKSAIATEGDYRVESGKAFTIDLNSCEIAAPSTPLNIRHGNVEIVGKGTIRETEPNSFGAIYMLGSFEEEVANYSTVKIGKDVTLRGWSGIMIDGPNKNRPSYKGYGVVVESDATIKCPIEGDTVSGGTGIYINGSNKLTEGPVPQLTIRGQIIVDGKSGEEEGSGIYAAGYGKWVLDGTRIEAKGTAVEIRAGIMSVKDSTCISTAAEYSLTPNGSGSTTEGCAIAVAQHTTKLPVEVTLSKVELEGPVGLAVVNPQKNDAASCAKVRVEGTKVTYKTKETVKISEDFEQAGTDTSPVIKAKTTTEESK